MEKEFIPYEQALDLKELGFDEPCLAFYDKDLKLIITGVAKLRYAPKLYAPLYQQAFRWFREKYNFQKSIVFYSESQGIKKIPNHYEIQIDYLSNDKWCYFESTDNKIYLTYEEAELECLKKLIEICKNN